MKREKHNCTIADQSELIVSMTMFRISLFIVTVLGTLSSAFGWAVASDATGRYVTAAGSDANSHVIFSSDYGNTWNNTSNKGFAWTGITSDKTGQKLVTVADCSSGCSLPTYSEDEGATWTTTTADNGAKDSYYGVASDATGDQVVAVGSQGVYFSSNGGASWQANKVPGRMVDYGKTVAVSADASTVIINLNNYLSRWDTSTSSWVKLLDVSAWWNSISTDATGTVMAASYDNTYGETYTHGVYFSTDKGKTFTEFTDKGATESFHGVSVSDDGSMIFYSGSSSVRAYNVATKTTVKNTATAGPTAVDCSSNGQYVVLGSTNQLFVSSDYGYSYALVKTNKSV